MLDTQSVRAAAGVPSNTTGRDAAKKVSGRKRGLAVDALGLVIAVVVLAASAHDNTAGIALLDRVAAATPPGSVRTALVDQGFKGSVASHGATHGIDVKTVERNPADTGFVPQPKRWVVEQTYGTLALHRRLVRDHEHHPSSSESRASWAMTDVMARRLTGTSSPSWRPTDRRRSRQAPAGPDRPARDGPDLRDRTVTSPDRRPDRQARRTRRGHRSPADQPRNPSPAR
ncbi:transposase [Nonomuraea sp. SYSU D8015]|uniref:transposase n=1 Tax=Nonomuraea sp. SYSU D8015 TaxID=2593644 RepID=UPI001CB71988|nr:transposase [Nonomuraea sp. SYSU D8015]